MARVRPVFLCVGLGAVAACTAPESGRLYGVSTASAELQRDAIFACRDSLGFAGAQIRIDTDFRSRRYEENIYHLRVVPGGGIDANGAARINACAEESLAQRFGTRRPMVGPQDVTGSRPPAAANRVGAAEPQVVISPSAPRPSCVAGASVLQGGAGYCIGS